MAEEGEEVARREGGVGGDEVAGGGEDACEGFGGHAGGAEGGEAGVAVAFGEAAAVGADDKGNVDEAGRREVEGAVEEELVVGGVEEVVATEDFGNPHVDIVHDDGEGVARAVEGPGDDKVGVIGVGLLTVKAIGEDGRFVVSMEPPCGEW